MDFRALLKTAHVRLSEQWQRIVQNSSPAVIAISLCVLLHVLSALLDSVIYAAIKQAMLQNGFNPSGMGPQSASTGLAGVMLGQVSTALYLLPTYSALIRRNAHILPILWISIGGWIVISLGPLVGSLIGVDLGLTAFLLSITSWLVALAWAFLDVLCRIKVVDEIFGANEETHHTIAPRSHRSRAVDDSDTGSLASDVVEKSSSSGES